VTAGGQSHSARQGNDPNTVIVDGTTLSLGGLAATIGGLVFSAISSGVVTPPTVRPDLPPPCATAGTLAALSCPASNGSIYTPPGACIGSNASYFIDCGVNYGGNSVQLITGIRDVAQCIAYCTDDPTRVAVAFDDSTTSCLEKGSVAFANAIASPDLIFAYIIRYVDVVKWDGITPITATPTPSGQASGGGSMATSAPQISALLEDSRASRAPAPARHRRRLLNHIARPIKPLSHLVDRSSLLMSPTAHA